MRAFEPLGGLVRALAHATECVLLRLATALARWAQWPPPTPPALTEHLAAKTKASDRTVHVSDVLALRAQVVHTDDTSTLVMQQARKGGDTWEPLFTVSVRPGTYWARGGVA